MASLPSLEHFGFREYDQFYEPAEDTYLLVDALHAQKDYIRHTVQPQLCLEIGRSPGSRMLIQQCPGSGVVTAALCSMLKDEGSKYTTPLYIAADINRRAAEASKRTATANQAEPFEAVCCDLAGCMLDRLKGKIDVLLFNPPYVPTPPEEVGSKDITAAWAGGLRGREVIDRFLPMVKDLLSPGGCFYMVAVEDNNPAQIINIMRDDGINAEVLSRQRAKNEALCVLKMNHASNAMRGAEKETKGA